MHLISIWSSYLNGKRLKKSYTQASVAYETVIKEGPMKCAVQKENPEEVMSDRCD